MIQGSKSSIVTLKQSTVAIQRAQGMDVRTLAVEYSLSPNQMMQALIDMGYAKPRAGSKITMKPKTEKEQKFDAACTKYNITADQLYELLNDLGFKAKRGVSARKYSIIFDVKKPEATEEAIAVEAEEVTAPTEA